MQGSNDGTQWTDIDNQNDVAFTNRYEQQVFLVNTSTTYTYFRLLISARNSNVDSGFQFAEWELYGTAIANYDITDNEGQITGQYVGNLSDTNNELVDKVIDNNSTTKYLVKDYSQLWIQYQSPVKARLTSYNTTSANDENTRDIKTWALYGSND